MTKYKIRYPHNEDCEMCYPETCKKCKRPLRTSKRGVKSCENCPVELKELDKVLKESSKLRRKPPNRDY